MKTNNTTNRYLQLIFCCIFSVACIYIKLTKDSPRRKDDLVDYSGIVSHFSFQDNIGYKSLEHQYYIYLIDESCRFQISAEQLQFFDKHFFQNQVRKGDRIEYSISKKQSELLGTNETVLLRSFSVRGFDYLTKEETFKSESSLTLYVFAIILFVWGIVSFVFYKR